MHKLGRLLGTSVRAEALMMYMMTVVALMMCKAAQARVEVSMAQVETMYGARCILGTP